MSAPAGADTVASTPGDLMGTATSNLRAATAGRAARITHVGLAVGTDASPGAELSTAPYTRQPVTWPTGDNDGEWQAPDVDIPTARTAAPTLVAYFTAGSGGEMVEWQPLETPTPTGVDIVRVTPLLRSSVGTA